MEKLSVEDRKNRIVELAGSDIVVAANLDFSNGTVTGKADNSLVFGCSFVLDNSSYNLSGFGLNLTGRGIKC